MSARDACGRGIGHGTCAFLAITMAALLGACDDPSPTQADVTPVADATAVDVGTDASDTANTPDVQPDTAQPDTAQPDTAQPLPEDLDMTAEDFECLTRWDKVRRFYITNKAGRLEETLAVANDPMGKQYPVGTVMQLVPFEAMVKRKAGWAPESNDWEFFALSYDATGTTIDARGTAGVVNQFGGECLPCHTAAKSDWDMVCESGHGCDPLSITDFIIDSVVANDERCP